jgi:hypothetical protein
MDFVKPPEPTEAAITSIATREVVFPNGRTVKLSLSDWHWEMIAFYDLWNVEYGREQGILYEWVKLRSNIPDRMLGDAIMLLIREQYDGWVKALPAGHELVFPAPRK